MSYRDLLVVVDHTDHAAKTFRSASRLARLFDAHVTTVFPIPILADLPYAGFASDAAPITDYLTMLEKEAEETRKQLAEISDQEMVSMRWLQAEGLPHDIVSKAGRLVDLVVLSQNDPDNQQSLLHGVSDEVLLSIGRPTLILPYIGIESVDFKRILVGWDGGQAATRAVNDAMPMLQRADMVEVVSILEAGKGGLSANGNEDLCEHLLRHKVGAKSTSLPKTELSIGDQLLNHAADTGAELLVTGAYGHARWKEVMFGGATRKLLKTMTLPVLLSH